MSGETSPNPNNQDPVVTEWDSLSQFDAIEQNLQDDFLNIDDMLKSGRINEEQAEHFRKEVQDKADREWLSQLDSDSRKYLDDENANIDDMLRSGRINEEQAAKFRKEVKQKAQQLAISANEQSQSNAEDADVDTKNEESPDAQTIKDEESEKEAAVTKEKEIAEAEEKEKQAAEEAEKAFQSSFEAEIAKLEGLEGEEKIAAIKALMAEHEKAIASAGGKEKESEASKEIEELLGKAERIINEEKAERIKELKTKLDELRPELAELYARNRRLFVGSKNKEAFNRIKKEYDEMMTEYLRLSARESYEKEDDANRKKLQARYDELRASVEEQVIEFAGGDIKNTDKSPEEIEAYRQGLLDVAAEALRKEYGDQAAELKTKVNTDFLEEYIKEENDLWDETNDKLDNGSIFRRAVSKIITNKYFKGALLGAAVVGLTVTGVGLAAGIAAGTTAVSFGLGAGTAIGAAKGALSGVIMSSQSSESSALNAVDKETRSQNIREQLEGIDFLAENDDVKNAVGWMLEQYNEAKDTDHSKRKSGAIAAGISGALLGAAAGSMQINNVAQHETTQQVFKGYEPTEYDISANLDNIDIPEGHGIATLFEQAGGNMANWDQAEAAAHLLDQSGNYGTVWQSNGVIAGEGGRIGLSAHVDPGRIADMGDGARTYATALIQEWANQGLIPAQQIGGAPIYDTVTSFVTEVVPDFFRSALAWGTANVGFDAVVGAITDRKNRAKTVEAPEITGATPTPETPEDTPETPNNAPEAPEDDAEEPTVEATEESQPEEPTVSPEQEEPGPTESEQTTPEQTTPEQTAEEQASEESEENPAEESREGENRGVRELISSRLGDRLSEKDIHMLSINNSNNNDNGAFADWWNDEVDENKRALIRQFYQDESDNSLLNNSAFKLFLSSEEPAGFQAVQ